MRAHDTGFSESSLEIAKGDIVWWRWNNTKLVNKIFSVGIENNVNMKCPEQSQTGSFFYQFNELQAYEFQM